MTVFLGRSKAAVLAGLFMVIALLALAATPALATGSITTRTVTHLPALLLDNMCVTPADTANLHGDLFTTITTTPRTNGYTVDATNAAPNLTGVSVLYGYPYFGQDVERSHQFVANPPFPSTVSDRHWTRLVPQANVPSMYLVMVLKYTVAADGTTIVTLDKTYLTCTQPCDD